MKYRKKPEKMSPSSVSSFSDCEQKFAFERLIENVPAVRVPVPLIFGGVIHKGHEDIWKKVLLGKRPEPQIVRYWQSYLNNVFVGVHGPESQSLPPKPIGWLTPREEKGLTENETKEKIKEKKANYLGMAWLALQAIYLEAIASHNYSRTEIEYDFSFQDIYLKGPSGFEYPISGRIDRIHFLNETDYFFLDIKTGWSYLNAQRNKLVRDIQMTLYQYACERIFHHRPKAIFFQSVCPSSEQLKEKGAKALEELRTPVEVREDPVHFENLADLVEDVNQVIALVLENDRHSQMELNQWQPRSNWGKMAGFAANVREGRFIPRIGSWCNFCGFLGLCKKENLTDWEKAHRKTLLDQRPGDSAKNKVVPASLPVETIKDNQKTLFDLSGPRSRCLPKSDRQLKKEMRASGDFSTEKNFMARVRSWHKAIPVDDSSPCPCKRLKLVSWNLVRHVRELEKGAITIREVLKKCPFPGCPFKKQPGS